MVPIWTLSNPLRCLPLPKNSGGGVLFDICRLPMPAMVKKIDCLLFTPISNFLSKHCKIRIYNAFILSDFRYCTIVCHLCSRQPIYKRERNPKKGIPSSCNDCQISYQNLLNVVYPPTLFMGPIWKTLLFKCLNAWITSIPKAKEQRRASSAGYPQRII